MVIFLDKGVVDMVHQQIEKKCIAKVYEHTRHKPKKRILVEIMLVDLLKTQVEEEYNAGCD